VHGRSVLDLIGNTPLVGFKRIDAELGGVKVFGKAEWANPGGSVKDRAALSMILDGERRGALTQDKILVDATSGNTGIAYAMICAERGYRVKLALPKNASEERKQTLRAYGADLVLTDPTEGTDGAQRFVKLVTTTPAILYPDQYNNPPTGRLITKPPRWKSGGRRMGRSAISSRGWEPAGRSWASPDGLRN
jgi:cysteine synthase B